MTKNLNIQPNSRTGGYYCEFDYRGKSYYASLCNVLGVGAECMIFPAGQWSELYWARGIPITPYQLKDCIEEFIKSLDE